MAQNGIITKLSKAKFEQTYERLKNALNSNPNLKVIAELDHQANAARVGHELNPIRIIMFGNPNLGTPLMKNAQTTGLDLPQKILVYQSDAGQVMVSYNDPLYLKDRHGISEQDEILQKIGGALDKLTEMAISE